MKGLFLSCLTAVSAFAYSPDYFPLQVGNQWIYRAAFAGQSNQITVSVTRPETRAGNTYAVVDGLSASPALLRQDDSGVLRSAEPGSGEFPWANFATPEGDTYATFIDQCTTSAKVISREATVTTPAGTFTNALHISYSGRCADAGVISDYYVPWIGLVRRESTSFAGPRVMELVYSRTGGVTVLSQPEASFSLSLNNSVFQPSRLGAPTLEARLTLRVTTTPIELNFSSSQRTDFAIRNERGDTVYFASATRLYAAVVGQEVVGPGERNWTETIPLTDLPAGHYTLEGWLTTTGPKRFTATVGFEVAAIR